MSDTTSEHVKGTAKEIAGKITGSDEMVKEGQAQQEKAAAQDKAARAAREQDAHSGT